MPNALCVLYCQCGDAATSPVTILFTSQLRESKSSGQKRRNSLLFEAYSCGTSCHSMACAACREGRRRCDGAPLACGRCARIGRLCVYDRPAVAHPHAPAATFPHVVAPSRSGASGARVVRLTEEERGELRAVFDFTNRIFEAGMRR